jgi:creatinine amidohydrolase/Fe(II)-dependent formamide hydrolase-like protein
MTPSPEETAPTDPLPQLVVFERLDVGPVRVDPNRLTIPYTLTAGGKTESINLIYRYEEACFDPWDPAAANLGAMIGAQVALNYGLFCRQMVFHGWFDAHDRRLIREMAENTAREIYVNKFLKPNPFLVGAAAQLPALKKRRYLAAGIRFKTPRQAPKAPAWKLWATDRGRHAVLSSGGKDSLLSFGLLRDLGGEVHPLFVNESGRHWFTALNAYRHFKEKIPETGRVWVNSDRLFNWFLQRMPFIRKNFANLRSDDYPIRLWTVAVFLFGVLPILRKRGIGRLIIGDEYDTTVKAVHQGISHYCGLYDQSVYFDHALSSYFLAKGWNVSQFSILRPLSELLIEKILLQRYPELQQLQTSCHAAHKGKERIVPCGRCEKCRRIVAMLTAFGGDPRQCGYTPEQTRHCLDTFWSRGVSQVPVDVGHLAYMLTTRGETPPDPAKAVHKPKAHAHTLKLRFDPRQSFLETIPDDLRRPLYEIMAPYTEGAVQRQGRQWRPIDPLGAQGGPYPFEVAEQFQTRIETQEHTPHSSPGGGIEWAEYTWPDIAQRLKSMDVALLPVGALEQHGPHLTLDTDAFDAVYLARRVAMACSHPQPLVLPGIPYGVSYHHSSFPGTIEISCNTMSHLIRDIGVAAASNGIKKLVIINGHGGNDPALNYAAQMINRDTRIFVCVDSGETSDFDIDKLASTPNDVHAGEIETSTSLAVRPHLVKMDQARAVVPEFSSRYLDFSSKRGVAWHAFTHKISVSGVMGDPTKADAEKGRKIWEIMVSHLVALVEDLKSMSLDEIHHLRY